MTESKLKLIDFDDIKFSPLPEPEQKGKFKHFIQTTHLRELWIYKINNYKFPNLECQL